MSASGEFPILPVPVQAFKLYCPEGVMSSSKLKSTLAWRLSSMFPSLTTSLPHSEHHRSSRKAPPADSAQYTFPPLSGLGISANDAPPSENSGPWAAKLTSRLQKSAPPPYNPPPPPQSNPDPETYARLRKEQRRRSSSVNANYHSHNISSSGLKPRQHSPPSEARGRSSSAQPPNAARLITGPENRVVSAASAAEASRATSSNGSQSPTRDSERRGRLRKSWLGGRRSRSTSQSINGPRQPGLTKAWILGQQSDYNTAFLANSERVPELWNESGEVLVYLDPKMSGGAPSFKVPSLATNSSLVFADLIEAEMASPASSGRARARSFTGRDSLSVSDAHRVQSPPLGLGASDSHDGSEWRLYLPVAASTRGSRSEADMERLISIRNMFAFLTGQPLVATKAQPTLFAVFLNIAGLLKEYEFANSDGTTFGEAVEMSFGFFTEQMALADVRNSREKTLESLILGERMRSMELYNEAFTHAVGKYSAIRDLNSPLWDYVSPRTRQRLERAHIELVGRQHNANNRLETFDYPALFSGTANSTSLTEYKDVKFNVWKKSFGRMRQFALGYYKASFGNWPPKARSKKNPFTESGLNRQVLKILYSDFCALYDLLADRESLTTRVIDQDAADIADDALHPHKSSMRKVLGEFDHSSPPVLPPIPFDLPMLPSMTMAQGNYQDLSAKEQSKFGKGLSEHQVQQILSRAYNSETDKLAIPLLQQFKEFELREAKGKSVNDMMEQRLGCWLFLYVVIQSLPMLVVDAPGLNYTEGVEYFLCQPPKGSVPWLEDAPAVRKRWYEVAGGGGLVELSEDAVQFGIEGIYHRSHCWLAAKQWELGQAADAMPVQQVLSPLAAPASVFEDMDANISPGGTRSASPAGGPPAAALRSRGSSPAGRHAYRKSIALGLEPVAGLPPPVPGSSSGHWNDSPSGYRRTSGVAMNRSRSSGNLQGFGNNSSGLLAADDGRSGSGSGLRHGSAGASTFDDILKGMEETKPKKKTLGLF
ncbi:hypothetical protein F5Y16DRAFT_369241 [Xylariaceae sp. FL0255]|nr:hypothetical protein F5Y16DRAFT_369241 [Xylariaceae sp. FL0255]